MFHALFMIILIGMIINYPAQLVFIAMIGAAITAVGWVLLILLGVVMTAKQDEVAAWAIIALIIGALLWVNYHVEVWRKARRAKKLAALQPPAPEPEPEVKPVKRARRTKKVPAQP